MTVRPTARQVALDVVTRVIEDRAYSNRVLPAALGRSGLDARDRAFATDLALGTLRRRLLLDDVISRLASRPLERMTAGARNALRLGAYQLLAAKVPPHAAVSATVDLVSGRERGFVNAVLRRVAEEPMLEERTDRAPHGAAEIAASTGLAPWAARELESVLGDEAAAAAAALATRAPVCLRVVGGSALVPEVLDELGAEGVEATPGGVDASCVEIAGGDPRGLRAFRDGRVTVQDQASAFVGGLVGASPGERLYDVCAAPGGKSMLLAEHAGDSGVVVAADRSLARTRLIAGTGARLGMPVQLVVQDAVAPAVAGSFDGVLVDAPCSGLGSARRRPELLWRVDEHRLPTLAALQLAIVTAAADAVRPGGRLVYAVCTFTRAETDAVCDALLRARGDLEPVATPGPDGHQVRHRLWPHRHGCDGMFAAAFRRVA
jgi:16S rRNA (cytosine967-C5)-methyltransferase